ncbi:MAG: acyltransferase family protein [Anaerolineae bacterium]|nr:acyltransferase family protein [Anaerolineae bacterium]
MLAQPAAITRSAASRAATLVGRLFFFDNLRIVAMALVIMQHVGQVYGPTEGVWMIPPQAETAFILDPFFTVNRSFGMSLFFMIAGYFAVLSCDKKGPRPFLKDRAVRLGIPLLGWAVFMALVQIFLMPTPATGNRLGIPWPVEVAHMWFVELLLIFCAVYAVARMLLPARPAPARDSRVPPGWAIVLFALGLAFASAVVRIWYDMDEWVYVLGVIKLQPFDLPRDLALFIVGMLAARRDWVMRFPSRSGRVWLGVGVALAAAWYAFRLAFPAGMDADERLVGGLFTLWESFLCVGMCIGLTVLFRDLWNWQNSLLKNAAQAQYATYVFHIGVVLVFQWLAMPLDAPPLVKFLLVSLFAVPVSFLVGYWLRKPLRM